MISTSGFYKLWLKEKNLIWYKTFSYLTIGHLNIEEKQKHPHIEGNEKFDSNDDNLNLHNGYEASIYNYLITIFVKQNMNQLIYSPFLTCRYSPLMPQFIIIVIIISLEQTALIDKNSLLSLAVVIGIYVVLCVHIRRWGHFEQLLNVVLGYAYTYKLA